MYRFRLRFRNNYTSKVLYRSVEIDTCMWGYVDILDFGYESFDEFAWSQAIGEAHRMKTTLSEDPDCIEIEGITLISK